MTQVTELEPSTATETTATVTDRRRPGRVENVNPGLIPLLRGQEQEPEASLEFEDVDQIAALRGVLVGVLFSAPIWAGLAYLGSRLLSK